MPNSSISAGFILMALVTALCLGSWFWGRDYGRSEIRQRWDIENRKALAEAEKRDRENRETEAALRRDLEEARRVYLAESKQQQAASDAVLADLRGGNLRLRERLRGCSAAAGAHRDPASGAGVDGAAQAGLSRTDEEFLVRLAAEADANALRLASVQDYIRALLPQLQACVHVLDQ